MFRILSQPALIRLLARRGPDYPKAMLYYACALAPDVLPMARRPHDQQSEAAEALLGALRRATRIAGGPSSKSHSRAMSAVALIGSGQVGVDVEFACTRRNKAGLAQFLLGEDGLAGWPAIYRLWTLREAYFKAFGIFPDRQLLQDAHASWPLHAARWGQGPMQARHEQRIDPASGAAFHLTLVWSGAQEALEIAL